MRNITLTVQDETYREIRAWCARRDTCVSHVVQAFLKDLPRLQHVHRFPLPEAPARPTDANRAHSANLNA